MRMVSEGPILPEGEARNWQMNCHMLVDVGDEVEVGMQDAQGFPRDDCRRKQAISHLNLLRALTLFRVLRSAVRSASFSGERLSSLTSKVRELLPFTEEGLRSTGLLFLQEFFGWRIFKLFTNFSFQAFPEVDSLKPDRTMPLFKLCGKFRLRA